MKQSGDLLAERVREVFIRHYGTEPLLIGSPGRINLIGEHTDYNEGFVLPAAMDQAVVLALGASGSQHCEVRAMGLGEVLRFDTGKISPGRHWENYILGVASQLSGTRGLPGGFWGVFDSNLPIGAGLSSSAALEGAFSFGLNELLGLGKSLQELARAGQLAEHKFVRVQCGIMDQFANLFGRKDHLIRLDCRSLEAVYYPFPFPDYSILLCNTGVSHSLASSEYNARREQCAESVRIFRQSIPSVNSLRDLVPQQVLEFRDRLPEILFRRSLYVCSENERVLRAGDLLESGNLEAFGELLYRSHEGLSTLYEVSCPELDFLVDLAHQRPEVAGARMMGGGFGGCTINIVERRAQEDYSQYLSRSFEQKFGKSPEIYITSIEDGTRTLTLDQAGSGGS